ncbi:MAG: GtrA family protein [Cyclobacteriaceae bacterium]
MGQLNYVLNIIPIGSIFQFGRFFLVGVISAAIEMSILIGLVEYVSWDYLAANLIAFNITNLLNYVLSRMWVFTSDNNKIAPEFKKFMIFVLIGLLINQFFLWVFVEFISLDYKTSKVLAIGITIVWNFVTRKHLIFKSADIKR